MHLLKHASAIGRARRMMLHQRLCILKVCHHHVLDHRPVLTVRLDLFESSAPSPSFIHPWTDMPALDDVSDLDEEDEPSGSDAGRAVTPEDDIDGDLEASAFGVDANDLDLVSGLADDGIDVISGLSASTTIEEDFEMDVHDAGECSLSRPRQMRLSFRPRAAGIAQCRLEHHASASPQAP
jgi:hypothetical protein